MRINQTLKTAVGWIINPSNISALLIIVIIMNILLLWQLIRINNSLHDINTDYVAQEITQKMEYSSSDIEEQLQNIYYEINKLRLSR